MTKTKRVPQLTFKDFKLVKIYLVEVTCDADGLLAFRSLKDATKHYQGSCEFIQHLKKGEAWLIPLMVPSPIVAEWEYLGVVEEVLDKRFKSLENLHKYAIKHFVLPE